MQVNKLNLGRIIFHLECSLNTGRITPKEQCDSHMHTIGNRCSTNFKFSPRTMKGGGGGGINSVPIFSFSFVSLFQSSKDQSNGRNVNEQST